MTDTTETRTAGRSWATCCFSPFHWEQVLSSGRWTAHPLAPATLTKDLQGPQMQLDARIRGRIRSWWCPTQQGWNLDRLRKTINNHSFSEAVRGPKSHMCWGESGDAQGWMQHWKLPAAIRIGVVTMTGSPNLLCLSRKSSRHLSPLILPTGCISPDSHPQTEFQASPGTLLVTADPPVIPRLAQSPPLDLILIHWFAFLAWPGSASSTRPCPVTWALGWICPPAQACSPCSAAGLAAKERHLKLT